VVEEQGFVVMGGQADVVSTVVKERYREGLSLSEAMSVAIAAMTSQGNGDSRPEVTAGQLEVAVLDRNRRHRMFQRLTGPRLESLLSEANSGTGETSASDDSEAE
jgi:proteasome alpha subunit